MAEPSPHVTRDVLHPEFGQFRSEMRAEFAQLRADLHRALWLFSTGIVVANAATLTAALTLAPALD